MINLCLLQVDQVTNLLLTSYNNLLNQLSTPVMQKIVVVKYLDLQRDQRQQEQHFKFHRGLSLTIISLKIAVLIPNQRYTIIMHLLTLILVHALLFQIPYSGIKYHQTVIESNRSNLNKKNSILKDNTLFNQENNLKICCQQLHKYLYGQYSC